MNTPADTHSYVELRNINKTFGDYRASDDVSFSIEKGKLIGLLGPSGSGKITILRILAGLETADSGDIYIDGKKVNDIPASKREIGFVFQNYALFRGSSLELTICINGTHITAHRQLGQELIREGETVNVFVHKLYLVDDSPVSDSPEADLSDNVRIEVNEALSHIESVVI